MDDGACAEVVGHEGMEQPTFLLIFGTGDVPLWYSSLLREEICKSDDWISYEKKLVSDYVLQLLSINKTAEQ